MEATKKDVARCESRGHHEYIIVHEDRNVRVCACACGATVQEPKTGD